LLLLTGTTVVRGQEAATAAESPSPAAVEAPAPAETADAPAPPTAESLKPSQAFTEQFTRWKKILAELRNLKYVEYPEAGIDRRVEIAARYEELIAEGEAMQDDLIAAALAAFEEAPNADPDVLPFLLGIVSWDCQTDDYENAFEMAQRLLDGGVQAPQLGPLAALAGEAAFCTNRFDLAEKYFKTAADAGALEGDKDKLAHQGQLGYYKAQWKKEKEIRDAEAEADDLPRVLIKTRHGDMVIELFENEAPNTVANFISLVKKGFYDGLTFHRVLPNFMAQGKTSKFRDTYTSKSKDHIILTSSMQSEDGRWVEFMKGSFRRAD
jgi:tetratricopeptide (TPR) repeat protein